MNEDNLFEVLDGFEEDVALSVLKTYLHLHEGRISDHWLWIALTRIAAGESEEQVLADYRYYRGVE